MALTGKQRSGVVHKVLNVLFRLGELVSAIIVLALLSRFSWLLHTGSGGSSGRVIYTMVVAALAIIFSILLIAPITALFLGFPLDFLMWIMWLIAFCLLASKSGTHVCSSSWYNNYWGYYWGRWWRTGPIGTVRVGNTGCGEWRSVLAFSFIAMILHLLSGILGIYVSKTYGRFKKERTDPELEKQQMAAAHQANGGHETGYADGGRTAGYANGDRNGGYVNGEHQNVVNAPNTTTPATAQGTGTTRDGPPPATVV